MNIDQVIKMVAEFIKNFPEYHEIYCYCARKSEMKLWKKLFLIIGQPEYLFLVSLTRCNII